MAPLKDKGRAAGVSASSFLDLKAELAKQESEYVKSGKRKNGGIEEVCRDRTTYFEICTV